MAHFLFLKSGTASAGGRRRHAFFPHPGCPKVSKDQNYTPKNQQCKDQNSTVSEEVLGQQQNNRILPPIKQPIGLARKEDTVEYHKGPVKVQRRQSSHHQKGHTQSNCGPEARSAISEAIGTYLFLSAPDKQGQKEDYRNTQHSQIQLKQPPHIGKMTCSRHRPGQYTHRKLLRKAQTKIHHLIVGGDNLHFSQPVGSQIHRTNMSVVKRTAQQWNGNGPGDQKDSREQRQNHRQRFAGFH